MLFSFNNQLNPSNHILSFMIKLLPPNLFRENSRRYGFLLFLFFSLFLTAGAFAQTVTSDKDDYAPRSNAVFSGTGFAANENIVLKVKNLSRPCNTVSADSSYLAWTVKADINGGFRTNWTVCDCLGDSLRLKAQGQTSGFIAYAYFTDGDIRVESVSINPFSPSGTNTTRVTVKNYTTNEDLNKHAVRIKVGSDIVYESTNLGNVKIGATANIDWDGKYNLPKNNARVGSIVPDNNYTIVVIDENVTSAPAVENTVTGATKAITIDRTVPKVTINQAGLVDQTSSSPVNFTVTFSESVNDFATGDVTLSGTAGATTATVTGSGTTYNVAVTGMVRTGTVIATIAANVAQDAAGNKNSASTSTDNIITFNTCTAPSITAQPISNGSTFTYGDTPNPSFSVSTSGDVSGYQWQLLTTASGATWSDISGATSASFTVLNPTVAMNGYKYRVVISGCSSTLPPSDVATLTVKPKALIINTPVAQNKVYDKTDATIINGTLNGIVNGDAVSLVGTGTFASVNVANGITVTSTSTLSGAAAGNYSLTQPTSLTANITPKALSITAPVIASKEYNGSAATGEIAVGALSGFVGSETVTATATGLYTNANAGTAKSANITYTLNNGTNGGLATNYSLATGTGSGDITPKGLTAASTITSKVYDGSAATGVVTLGTVTGLIGTETLTITPSASNYSNANVGIGKATTISYLLANGSGLAANYSIAPLASTADITARSITASISATDKVYDGTDVAAATGSATGVAGASVAVTVSNAKFNNANVGTDKAVTANVAIADANYSLTAATAATTADITVKQLTPAIVANNKIFDNSTVATLSNQTVNEVVNGEVVGLAVTAANFASKERGTHIVTATGLSLTGAASVISNYYLAPDAIATTTATIFAIPVVKSLTVSDPLPLNSISTITAILGEDVTAIGWVITKPSNATSTSTTIVENSESVTIKSSVVGVYSVSLIYQDGMNEKKTTAPVYAVFYDPNAGFVTGGGWVNSPIGNFKYMTVTGKANFGFVSKYEKGANKPSGNTEFQFQAAGMNFKSSIYEWLTVAGTRAQYKGSGTINGTGDYGFMLTAVDGDLGTTRTSDLFRIKIWDKVSGATVYDNQLGASDDPSSLTTTSGTTIGGGSIVIHEVKATGKSERVATQAEVFTPATATESKLTGYPNPFRDNATIAFTFGQDEEYNLDIYDTKGALVKHYPAGKAKANTQVEVKVDDAKMPTGVYIIKLSTKTKVQNLRMVRE